MFKYFSRYTCAKKCIKTPSFSRFIFHIINVNGKRILFLRSSGKIATFLMCAKISSRLLVFRLGRWWWWRWWCFFVRGLVDSKIHLSGPSNARSGKYSVNGQSNAGSGKSSVTGRSNARSGKYSVNFISKFKTPFN